MFISRIASLFAVTALLFAQSALAAPVPNVTELVDFESNLVKRAGEEFFFRFESPSVIKAGKNILPLAPRPGQKTFDDQAYKFISTDVTKVNRAKIPGRLATIYVLPAGTRANLNAKKRDFEVERDAKRGVEVVFKDNEPGDLGINGVINNGKALSDFRKKVIRTVIKQVSAAAGGKATFVTITNSNGKAANTASKDDQKKLAKFN